MRHANVNGLIHLPASGCAARKHADGACSTADSIAVLGPCIRRAGMHMPIPHGACCNGL